MTANFSVTNLTATSITATSITETSSFRYKTNIRPLQDTVVPKLKPVIYDRTDGSAVNEAGLIAEDVVEVAPNLVKYDADNNPDGVHYTRVIPYLVDHIQRLEKRIEDLENG